MKTTRSLYQSWNNRSSRRKAPENMSDKEIEQVKEKKDNDY